MDTDIKGEPVITKAEAHRAVLGLQELKKYKSRDLYDRYVAQCRAHGQDPVHIVPFGRALRVIGCEPRKLGNGSKARAAWLITSTALRPEWGDGRW